MSMAAGNADCLDDDGGLIIDDAREFARPSNNMCTAGAYEAL